MPACSPAKSSQNIMFMKTRSKRRQETERAGQSSLEQSEVAEFSVVSEVAFRKMSSLKMKKRMIVELQKKRRRRRRKSMPLMQTVYPPSSSPLDPLEVTHDTSTVTNQVQLIYYLLYLHPVISQVGWLLLTHIASIIINEETLYRQHCPLPFEEVRVCGVKY